jgi:low affinity Fe/Cu permease
MVFLIQNSHNRDSSAVQLKLDELLRGGRQTKNTFINLEDLTEEDLRRIIDALLAWVSTISRLGSFERAE